ncbi:MAG: GTP-binding protein [Clostridiales bacterium]|nr:GTP-binding protein [Clostridiales bacterium]
MTKIDIFSGFLGAGKTTLIKKLIAEAYTGEKIVLIENEFGEIAIDGGFLKDSGVQINEMNSGCICCSLVGDFADALQKVLAQFHPDRILIEPSGVGKLSDVIRAVQGVQSDELVLNGFTTVVDANKCRMYMKNFGEFFNNQVENASAIILSRTEGIRPEKLDAAVALLREKNPTATIVTTPWTELDGKQILETMERRDTLSAELEHLKAEAAEGDDEDEHEHHHHHHDDEDEHEHECCCGHHHHDDDEDDDDHEHEHEHHHDHDEHDHDHCCGHDHDHDDHDHDEHGHDHCCGHHHHHHHADEVFTSWGTETPRKYTDDEIRTALDALINEHRYGVVLRAKGIVPATDGGWIHFDYVPGESDVRRGSAQVTGRVCVIGSHLAEDALKELFHIG